MRFKPIKPLHILREDSDVIFLNPETKQWYLTTPEGEAVYHAACKEGLHVACSSSDYTEEEILEFLSDLTKTLNQPIIPQESPRGSAIYVTNSCNMRCEHCRFSCTKSSNDLPMQTISDFIDMEHKEGSTLLTVTGGEPLLVWEKTKTALEHAHVLGMTTNLLTNGSLVTSKIADFLADRGTTVQVSLDSLSPEKFYTFRKFPLEPVMRGIRQLLEAGVAVHLSFCLSKTSIEEIESIFDFVKHNKIAALHFPLLERGGRATKSWSDYALTDDELVAFFEMLLHRYFVEGLRDEIHLSDIEMFLKQIAHPPATQHCNLFQNASALFDDGKVYGCTNLCGDPRFLAGIPSDPENLRTNRIKLRQALPKLEEIQECCACELQFLCLGGCKDRVMLANNGCLAKPDPYCKVLKYLYKKLLFIQANLQEELAS
jgi:radical SAM protein with 4Fe4S-binding SPASM domain